MGAPPSARPAAWRARPTPRAPSVAQGEDFVQDRVRFLNMFMSDLVAVPYLDDDNLLDAFLTLPSGREFDNFKRVSASCAAAGVTAHPCEGAPPSRCALDTELRAPGQRGAYALV